MIAINSKYVSSLPLFFINIWFFCQLVAMCTFSIFFEAVYDHPIYGLIFLHEFLVKFGWVFISIQGLCLYPSILSFSSGRRPLSIQARLRLCWHKLQPFKLLLYVGWFSWHFYIVNQLVSFGVFDLFVRVSVFSAGSLVVFLAVASRTERIIFFTSFIPVAIVGLLESVRGPVIFPVALWMVGRVVLLPVNSRLVVSCFWVISLACVSTAVSMKRAAVREDGLTKGFEVAREFFFNLEDSVADVMFWILERLISWPTVVAHEFFYSGNSIEFPWIDEFLLSFSLSNLLQNTISTQSSIIESGMLYGFANTLGFESGPGYSIPVSLVVESVARGGVQLLFVNFLLVVTLLTFISRFKKIEDIFGPMFIGYIIFLFFESHSVYVLRFLLYAMVFNLLLISWSRKRCCWSKSRFAR